MNTSPIGSFVDRLQVSTDTIALQNSVVHNCIITAAYREHNVERGLSCHEVVSHEVVEYTTGTVIVGKEI